MDATEAQLKFGASLTNSLDSTSAGSSLGGNSSSVLSSQQHTTSGGSGGGHRRVPDRSLLASLADLG